MRQPLDYYRLTALDRVTAIPVLVRIALTCAAAFLVGYLMSSGALS